MRAMWKGTVSFGLVAIPINLYAATESKNITFRQVHRSDGGRVQTKRVCSVDGAEVPYHEVAKGYETEAGDLVVLTEDDLAKLPVTSTKNIDVVEFVPLAAIDPIYYDKTYYLEPQREGLKPYVLLRDALGKAGQVAVAKIALRHRESLAVLRVVGDCLALSTMLWPDEVREPDFAFLREDQPQVREQELAMASSLVDSLSEAVFEPDKYEDSYRAALRARIDEKISGREVTTPAAEQHAAEVIDLVSALTASVRAARDGRAAPSSAGSAATSGGKAAKDTAAGGKSVSATTGRAQSGNAGRGNSTGAKAGSAGGGTAGAKSSSRSGAKSGNAGARSTRGGNTGSKTGTGSTGSTSGAKTRAGDSKAGGSKAGARTGSKSGTRASTGAGNESSGPGDGDEASGSTSGTPSKARRSKPA